MTNPSVSFESLQFGHTKKPLFEPLTMRCEPGSVCAVLGGNGRGKSTLLATVTGVLRPVSGRVTVSGGAALVPQSFRPAFGWSVREVVLMGRARSIGLFSQPSPENEKRCEKALGMLGIAGLAGRDFSRLSGGQQQLALIARALVSESRSILLDEPCSALDLSNQQVVLRLIVRLAQEEGRTVIFTTHDPTHALEAADTTLLLYPGGKWTAGPSDAVLTEENLGRAYGIAVRRIPREGNVPVLAPEFSLGRRAAGSPTQAGAGVLPRPE